MAELPLFTYPLLSGKISISPMPGRGGSLLAHLAQLLKAEVSAVVTLTEAEELARHGAEDLGEMLLQAGLDWHHLPITDFGTPDAAVAAEWAACAPQLLEALRTTPQSHVLFHCMGGQGRSGMMALSLMCLAGEGPEAALKRLREKRPGAVETEAQYAFATAQNTPEY